MGLKDAKVNFLIDIATDLFLCRSIQDVTIKDIAVSAQVGEATIYRYFGKKQTIVVQSAMKLKSIVNADYFQVKEEMNGFQKMEAFYMSYFYIFMNHPEFYKFLSEFDAYMTGENSEVLNPYESAIDQYKHAYMYARRSILGCTRRLRRIPSCPSRRPSVFSASGRSIPTSRLSSGTTTGMWSTFRSSRASRA